MHHQIQHQTPAAPTRRGFLDYATYLFGAVATVLAAIPIVGYLVRVPKRRTEWAKLGPVADFPAGETRMITFNSALGEPWDGMTAHTGVFVRYEGGNEKPTKDDFLVLAVNCAHLGCPVSWFPPSGLFMCPCHGGVYYATGERASGPPPRGLFRCVTKIEDGKLWVQAPHYPTLQDTLGGDKAEAG
jgi:Rieske Fe-S protein